MTDANKLFPVPADVAAHALIDAAGYAKLYAQSIADPDGFWREHAKRIDWIKPFTVVKNTSFDLPVSIKWFEDGALNVAANCLDRHLEERGDKIAIIWEGDDPKDSRTVTYRELHAQVCKLSNVLKSKGVKKGDRVTIYMPMIVEAAVALLACARIGAVHSVVFGGFSPEALRDRIQDSKSRIVITADEGLRGGKRIPLKANVDAALTQCPFVDNTIVVRRTGGDDRLEERRATVWYHDADGRRRRPRMHLRRWARRTRCSSSIPPARPANPRACCTPPAVISSGRR